MNVTVQLDYKLAYYDSTIHRFNHYTTRTPPLTVEEILEAIEMLLEWFIVLLLGWVIEIIIHIVTYNEKDLFLQDVQGPVIRSILLLNLARKTGPLAILISKKNSPFYTEGCHLFSTTEACIA